MGKKNKHDIVKIIEDFYKEIYREEYKTNILTRSNEQIISRG